MARLPIVIAQHVNTSLLALASVDPGVGQPLRFASRENQPMKRILRILAVLACLLLIGGALVGWSMYRAVKHVRPFYAEAVVAEPEELEAASRELESQATALYSDTQAPGRWSAVFTDRQLNGWLATQLAGEHSKLIPPGIRDPRLATTADAIQLGFLSVDAGIETVVSLDASVFLTDANQTGTSSMAIRLRSIKAGLMPLPAGKIAEEIRTASQSWSLPIQWTRMEGDIVALVDLGEVLEDKSPVTIDTLELRQGEIFISGETRELEVDIPVEETLSL